MTIKLTITDAARAYIVRKLESEKALGLRLSITKTGCSGYAYSPEIIQQAVQSSDISLVENDVPIFIDTTWQHLLDGVEIDFIEDGKTGLRQKRLVFKNKKESARCGCGESFHIEKG